MRWNSLILKVEKILEDEFRVEVESASDEGILILSNIGGRRSEFDYLLDCFKKIASRNYTKTNNEISHNDKDKHLVKLFEKIQKEYEADLLKIINKKQQEQILYNDSLVF